MAQFTVSTEEVRATADQISQGASEIKDQLMALLGQVNGLQETWRGQASSSMEQFYTDFNAKAQAMSDELAWVSQAMQTVATHYDDTESFLTSVFQRS